MTAIAELVSSRELLLNLARRDITGKYKRTTLGQLWSLINPIAVMATYSVVFSFVLKAQPSAGDPSGVDVFALWLACALLPWIFFSSLITSGMGSLMSNANLIKKVYFRREVLIISDGLAGLFTFSVEMLVLVVAILIFGGSPLLYLPGTVVVMLLLFCFGLGLSFILSVANVYFRDTQHFVSIFLNLMFYATPIVYPAALVLQSHPGIAVYYRLNPLERFSEAFRNLMYDGRWPTLYNDVYLVAVSLGTLVVGFAVFQRFEGKLAEEL